jgi:hypothetical protein
MAETTGVATTDTSVDEEVVIPVDEEDDSTDEGTSAVAGKTNVVGAIQGLNDPASAFYSSIKGTDFVAKKSVASALTNSVAVDDNLGRTISLVNVIVRPVDLVNRKSGEVETAPRVILIDKDGIAYHATSIGLLNSIQSIFAVLGEPATWPEPLDIKIKLQKSNNGPYRFFTIDLV